LPIDITANVDRMVTIPEDLFKTWPDYLLKASGDSMIDAGIFDGDMVAIKKCETARHGQIVVVLVDTDEMSREERKECGLSSSGITIKRLTVSGNKLLLKSENRDKNYAPIIVRPERVRIEGRYVGLVRGS
jgi:repressor LexA